ncbi:ABC transporter permease [Catenuloplanes atrovinosus]|uniref:ABC-type transport system involved in multi-copper enzyme maturation permease subunit n=1 Tax=Catenuloplanes atrovinosus TaxID=137266 RepID=A0AAE3YNZ7_9ACTN|nr:ABC transporter permease [Catenuloplanes atrovinosus]MDR7277025.1 ABC-type transport system involved in multi-copper enzyme maturation permease subunit [Catenuloplanes atrovinosus]
MNLIRSEWTKLRSVRSTWLAAVSAVASGVALSVLGATDLLGGSPADLPAGWDPTWTSLKGFLFAQLIIGMLGALSVTPEFGTGLVGTSLVFVPSRSRLLAAKTVVVAGLGLLVALATTLLSFTVVQLMLGGAGLPAAGVADPGVAAALAGAVLYLTLVALVGLAVGALARSATTSLAVLVGALLLVPALGPGLPGVFGELFGRLWPITAGQSAYAVVPVHGTVAPATGIVLLTLTAVAVTVAGHVAFRVRDV